MSRFETASEARGVAYSLEVPLVQTPDSDEQAVELAAARCESRVIPADVQTATADQESRRAYANRRGGEAAARALVRVA